MYGFRGPSESKESSGAKDPPVIAAEKFLSLFIAGDSGGIYNVLDPKVVLATPMGVFHGRPHVKGWVQFEANIIKRIGLPITNTSVVGEAAEGSKSATIRWSIGLLSFTDVVQLNQVQLIKSIRRTWQRRAARNAEEQQATNSLLLAWTGPHFEKYCAPKTTAGVERKATVLPVIDFSFCNLVKARDMLVTAPRDAKTLTEREVVLHYLEAPPPEEKAKKEAAKEPGAAATRFGASKDEITIRARNRDGDQGAIVIDRNSLKSDLSRSKSAVDTLEDNEAAINEDRVRYVGSSLRLSNNGMQQAKELDQVIRLCVFNAFYFLTWVDLSTNKLTSIPDLSTFPILVLYLHDNAISDWQEVKKLNALSQLQTLTLFGNPIQATATSSREYKFKALAAIKGNGRADSMLLRTFDHCVLSPAERENVDRFATSHSASRSRPQSRQ